ncbi:lysozyme [Asticcacaulis machinosus]|uniref:Lysozyme n=1 Tax=Asticcacaulis machinosus TaxID=2984211 RepID=A0ABT5HHE0_9CAUL|nr:glycoside hydrolase family protein [Asticcacaulis machinosus]MDC7675618.1 glycoside hydrolase family protein [Asticcacaulis machinosus]
MSGRLKISRAGVELIKSFEGLRQVAAKLPDGRWTLGYGHTFSAREGARVGPEDADALLRFDLLPIVDGINSLVHHPLNQNQFDALVSFCFNIGIENFAQSVVLKRINEGRLTEAALAMDSWSSAEFNGQTYVLAPLIRRRAAEKSLFLTPSEDEATAPQITPGMVVRPVEDRTQHVPPSASAPHPVVPPIAPVSTPVPVMDTPYGASVVDIARYAPASTMATGGEDDVPMMSESVQAALMKAQAEAKMRDDFERLEAVRAADEARRAEDAQRQAENARRANEDRLREEAMRQAQALAAARVAEQARLEQEKRLEQERQAQEAAKEAAKELARQELIRQEAARLDAARQEVARLEAAKVEAERIERDRLIEQERQRLESERLEAQRFEAARRLEAQRLEAERLEAIRQEAARETARVEAARAEALRAEITRQEAERREAARIEQERLATEARAQEVARLEAERLEAFRQEQARLEQARLELERVEQARLEQAHLEQERLEREAQAAIAEQARLERARLETEQRERDAEAARLRTEAETKAREQAAAEASAAAAQAAALSVPLAVPSAEDQQRKAEAAAALMRLYSPYASGLGQPLASKALPKSVVMPTPSAPQPPVQQPPVQPSPVQSGPVQVGPQMAQPLPTPYSPRIDLSAPVVPSPVLSEPAPSEVTQPEEAVRSAPDLTFQDEAELVARRNPSSVAPPVLIAQPPVSPVVSPVAPAAAASAGLHWREQLNRPVVASAEAAPVTVVETFEEVPAPVYRTHEVAEEAASDDDEWLSDGGRIAMSVDADGEGEKSIWKMFASTLQWIGTSVLGLAAIGGATAAYYKSTSDVELRDGTTDFNSLSIILAIAGMVLVCISVYLILKRLGGLKD